MLAIGYVVGLLEAVWKDDEEDVCEENVRDEQRLTAIRHEPDVARHWLEKTAAPKGLAEESVHLALPEGRNWREPQQGEDNWAENCTDGNGKTRVCVSVDKFKSASWLWRPISYLFRPCPFSPISKYLYPL